MIWKSLRISWVTVVTNVISVVLCINASREDFDRNMPYRNIAKCLDAIMSAEQNNRHFILIGDEINTHKLNITVYMLPWPKTVVEISKLKDVVRNFKGVVLLFPDTNATNYDIFLESISDQNEVKYVSFTESVLTVFHLFEQFWKFKILDVIVLYHSPNGVITVFTYEPFSRRGCDTDTPVRINKWVNKLGRFEKQVNLFSRKTKVYDLHGCPIRASMQASSFDAGTAANVSTPTIPMKIFRFLEKQMNFTGLIFEGEFPSVDSYTLAYMNFTNGNVLSLIRGNVDVALGEFSMLLHYGANIIGPLQNSMDCFTWAVPPKAGRIPSMWTTYVYEFDIYTWIVIFGLQCLATSFFHALCQVDINKEDSFSSSFSAFSSLGFLLGIAVKTKPKNDSLRVFYISMVLFCFVTNAAYQATMGSLVTVPPDSLDIDSTNELLGSDIVLTGNPRMFYLLLSSNKTSKTVSQVLERFQTLNPGAFLKTLRKVHETRGFAVFQRGAKLKRLEQVIKSKYNISDPYYIVSDCLFTAYNAPFLLKTGSMLLEPFYTLGTALVESGILSKWERGLERTNEMIYVNTTTTEEKVRKYSLKQLKGGLIILACGYTVSLAVFLAEILVKGFQHQNNDNTAVKKASKRRNVFIK